MEFWLGTTFPIINPMRSERKSELTDGMR